MGADDYRRYLAQEWQLFVDHPERAESAATISRHILPIRRVLDVGCGAGQELLPYLHGALCVALDLAEEACPVARQRLNQVNKNARLSFGRARAEALPIRKGQFDLVICRLVLPYTNIREVLAEAAGVLRPGGGFSVQVHSIWYYLRELRRAVARRDRRSIRHALRVLGTGARLHLLGQQPVGGPLETFITRAMLRRMSKGVGLEFVLKVRNGNPYAPHFLFRRDSVFVSSPPE